MIEILLIIINNCAKWIIIDQQMAGFILINMAKFMITNMTKLMIINMTKLMIINATPVKVGILAPLQ